MNYSEAYEKATKYLAEKTGNSRIDTVSENQFKWLFGTGKEMIGNLIISVNKKTGEISVVDFLSDEGFNEISNSTKIE